MLVRALRNAAIVLLVTAGCTTPTDAAKVATTITISPATFQVGLGSSTTLTATVKDQDGTTMTGQTVTWTSSNPAVASVDGASGLVIGVAVGTATITATVGGVSGTASATIIVLPGALSGRVYNAATNANLSGVSVTVVNSTGTTVATPTTASDGTYSTATLPGGSYTLTFTASGFVSTQIVSFPLNGNSTAESVPLVPTSASTGSISGTVYNATTNAPLTGTVTLTLRSGMNATTGTALQTVTTTTGAYTFSSVAAGTYTVLATASGFTNASKTGISVGATTTANQNIFISPTGTAGLVRIVLSWGTTPSDLDAHLTGPPVSGTARFHVYFANEGSCSTDPHAILDVDVTSGRGPETVTICTQRAGVYRYSINDYSAAGSGSNATSTTLANSQARVDLYINNALVRTFGVPSGAGSLWTVFELNGTSVTSINTITAGPAPASPPGGPAIADDGAVIFDAIQRNPKARGR